MELQDSLRSRRFESEEERAKLQNTIDAALRFEHDLRREMGDDVIEHLRDLNIDFQFVTEPYAVKIDPNKLVDRHSKFFRKRRKEYLVELIKRTSEVRFTFNYPLRMPVFNSSGTQRKNNITGICLRNVRVINDRLFNVDFQTDGIVLKFDTFLGTAYAHNLLTLNTDWFEEEYLKLEGYASAIYRRFFATRSGNKVDKLSIKEIVDHFGLLKNNGYPRLLRKAFEDIRNVGLIHDFRFKSNGRKFSKGCIEVVKSSK
jgi:hypothetical protein